MNQLNVLRHRIFDLIKFRTDQNRRNQHLHLKNQVQVRLMKQNQLIRHVAL